MKHIAFDVMRNKYEIKDAILAVEEFLKKNSNYKITLVGDENLIKPLITHPDRIEIFHEPNLSKKTDNYRALIKEKNSMNTALDLVNENKVDAVLSAGESGNYLSCATLKIKRLQNVNRPAFMPMIPQLPDNKYFLLLDAGANLEVKAEYFVQWAHIAKEFYKVLFNESNNPRVSILNIGKLDNKGFGYHIEANVLLKKDQSINYQGFIEGRDGLEGKTDIILADGYAGNIFLKTMEGTVLTFGKLLKTQIKSGFWSKIGGLILKPTFAKVKEKFDYRNVGAAWVIGLNAPILKSHSASDKKAFLGALNQIKLALDNDVLNKIKKSLV